MHTLYRIVLLLHILAAIVGFGGIIAHSVYNANAFRSTARHARELLAGTGAATKIAHYAIYAVMPLGVVLISLSSSDDVPPEWDFGAAWVSASFVVWFAMVGVAHALVTKNVKALSSHVATLADDTPLKDDETTVGLTKKLAAGEAISQLLLVIALFLMIWQPGG